VPRLMSPLARSRLQSSPPRQRLISPRACARGEHGQSVVIVAVLLTMLLSLVTLTVDQGSLYVTQRQTQSASDAASLAAAENLPLPGNTTAAASDATTYARTNDPNALPATSSTPVGGSGCTSPSYNSANPSSWAACFQAQVGVSQTVPLSFARLFGSNAGRVSATAVATVNLTPTGTVNSASDPAFLPVGGGSGVTNPGPACQSTLKTFCEAPAGSTIGAPGAVWTVTFGNVDWAADGAEYVNYTGPPGDSDADVIDMNGNEDGGIQQSVTTVVGQKYLLSFWLSGNAGYSEPMFTGTVGIGSPVSVSNTAPPATPTVNCPNGTLCIPFTQIDDPANQMNWEQVGIPFTATSTSTTISFESTSSQATSQYDNTGPTLAEVGVQPTQYSLSQ
jgi:Flp pilus assembly protein TadG